MRRIYIYGHKKVKNKIFITAETAHYLKNVLRMDIGSCFFAFEGNGTEYLLEITTLTDKYIETLIKEERRFEKKEPEITVELYISLCKTNTFENIIKKSAELGISKICPFISERSIIKISKDKIEEKIKRWIKIAAEGSKIAGRTKIPEITMPKDFGTVILGKTPGILFWEQSTDNLKTVIKNVLNPPTDLKIIRIFIGPEGGFTQQEVDLATKNGILIASLGPRILSVETATIAAVSILMYEIESL
ncbi:MAG: 16S rRNA (uracil(1498)-N(3))-methyltransferase [Candidatus Omnitrophica bacterium]|nr:16S rRNA (uracil(1498)-N(3))-methyltransferase [Candidatus Omnitrophota bacterium]MCM8816966.1 16S rRNA (uracil(1498)-N(3))-methyltransferase [Candidatus Omnitrophota bacterium]